MDSSKLVTQIQSIDGTVRNSQSTISQDGIKNLMRDREDLLYRLIAVAPAQALQFRESPFVTEADVKSSGSLSVVIADNFETHRSTTTYQLDTGTERLELFFVQDPPNTCAAALTVEGLRVRNHLAVRSASVDLSRAAGLENCTPTGTQNLAVILVNIPGQPAFPQSFTPAYMKESFFGAPGSPTKFPSLDIYIRESSYQQTSITGQVFGPITINTQNPCSDKAFDQAVIDAADKLTDLRQFTRLAFVFSTSICNIDGQRFGGKSTIGCELQKSPSKGQFLSSLMWIPIFPGYSPGGDRRTIYHEFGHSLGLHHSKSQEFDAEVLSYSGIKGTLSEYGDLYDAMGSSWGQYGAYSKNELGWLRPGEIHTVTQAGIYNLIPYENSSGVRALRILRDPYADSWLWVEYRQPIGEADSAIPTPNDGVWNIFQGALIRHDGGNGSSSLDDLNSSTSSPHLLDFTPNSWLTSFFDFRDAVLEVGKSWIDPYSSLRLTSVRADGNQLSLKVDYDVPCAQLQLLQNSFPAGASSGSISITAAETCSWQAKSQSPWISISAQASGKGSGKIVFTLTPNAEFSQRVGFILFERQRVRILQESVHTSLVSTAPIRSSGLTGTIEVRASHPLGGNNALPIAIFFRAKANKGYPECRLLLQGGKASIRSAVTEYVNLNIPGTTLSSEDCVFSVTTAENSYSVSGKEAIYRLPVRFAESSAGLSYRMWAWPLVEDPAVLILGTWTVPTCGVTLANAFMTLSAAGGNGTVPIAADSACGWTALGQASWLYTRSGAKGPGLVQITTDANPSIKPRNGTVLVSGRLIQITQAGAVANYTLSQTARRVATSGGNGQFDLTATEDAEWSIVSSAPWLVISSAVKGTGSAVISYRVERNPGQADRIATITVGGKVFTVTQLGSLSPVINSVNTVGGVSGLSENAWIEVKGSHLVPESTTKEGANWSNAQEFNFGRMPTSLGGVQVLVNGKPAYVYFYCSAATSNVCAQDQINVLTPADPVVGNVDVVVSSGSLTSVPFSVEKSTMTPSLLLFDAQRHIAATHVDGTLVGPATLFPGFSSPARRGETITIYGVGFGAPRSGFVDGASTQAWELPRMTCTSPSSVTGSVSFAGVISPGLAQINYVVPTEARGEIPISCTVSGASTPATNMLTVEP